MTKLRCDKDYMARENIYLHIKTDPRGFMLGGGGKDEKEEKRGEEGGRRGRGGEELSLDKLVGTK
jgi:hypothetical protein